MIILSPKRILLVHLLNTSSRIPTPPSSTVIRVCKLQITLLSVLLDTCGGRLGLDVSISWLWASGLQRRGGGGN